MKIQVLQENLNKSLTIASRSISTKVQLPILANILLKTDQNRLQISATNLETGIVLWLGAKIIGEGEISIPAKTLSEIVSSLSAGTIDLETEGNNLKLSSDRYNAVLNGIPASEFPKFPSVSEESLMAFPSEKLIEGINQVAFAAAADEGRPVLTGVLLKIEEKKLSLIATDGYRLSVKVIETESQIKETKSLLLPAKTLMEVGRIIADSKTEGGQIIQVGHAKEQNQTIFVFPEIKLFSRVIEGEFPDYEKIIPKTSSLKVILDKEEFNRAVKLVSVFAKDSSNIIRFKINKESMEISANSPQVGENKFSLGAKIEGEEMEIAFNFRFLQGFLGAVAGNEVSLELNGSLNPAVFRSVGDESFLHVIMPVRLQTE